MKNKRRNELIPGFALAAMAIGVAFVLALWIPAGGFGHHDSPKHGHCYGRGC